MAHPRQFRGKIAKVRVTPAQRFLHLILVAAVNSRKPRRYPQGNESS
jgi:hypothetical protein